MKTVFTENVMCSYLFLHTFHLTAVTKTPTSKLTHGLQWNISLNWKSWLKFIHLPLFLPWTVTLKSLSCSPASFVATHWNSAVSETCARVMTRRWPFAKILTPSPCLTGLLSFSHLKWGELCRQKETKREEEQWAVFGVVHEKVYH